MWESGRYISAHQCIRKPGHGPEGLYRRQHDPDVKAAKEAQEEAVRRADQDLKNARFERLSVLLIGLGAGYIRGDRIELTEDQARVLVERLR